MAKKTEVSETPASRNQISGFGDSVVKLSDRNTGEIICYVGVQEGEEKVFFKPVTPDQLEAVHELLHKKKFNKHISNERFDKAQEFADRKF